MWLPSVPASGLIQWALWHRLTVLFNAFVSSPPGYPCAVVTSTPVPCAASSTRRVCVLEGNTRLYQRVYMSNYYWAAPWCAVGWLQLGPTPSLAVPDWHLILVPLCSALSWPIGQGLMSQPRPVPREVPGAVPLAGVVGQARLPDPALTSPCGDPTPHLPGSPNPCQLYSLCRVLLF